MSAVKPTIPVEVADLIEHNRTLYGGPAKADPQILAYLTNLTHHASGPAETLRKIPFHTLLQALANGYEREMTEEERKMAEIAEMYHTPNNGEYDEGMNGGIKFVLDTLDIKIEGVNA